MLQSRERIEGLFGRAPVERAHGEIVVFFIPNSKLLLIVGEGKEPVRGVEVFVVFAVTALDLAVVTRRKRFDSFMLNTKGFQSLLK